MNLLELGKTWRATNEIAATRQQRDRLIATTCRSVEQFWGRIFRRDLIETAACVYVIIAFGWMQVYQNFGVLERIGAGVIVVGAAYIIYRLQAARCQTLPAPFDAPLLDYCNTELVRVKKQIKLLQTVLVWYLAPLMSGLVLMSLGKHGINGRFCGDLVIAAVTTWGMYALNQRAVRKKFLPLHEQLLTLRNHLEFDEDEREAHAMGGISAGAEKPTKRWRTFFIAILCGLAILLIALAARIFKHHGAETPNSKLPADAPLADLVGDLRKEKKLVGLAAMVTVDGKVVDSAADGERQHGAGVPIQIGDRWHLGSITKSITATMIARLVESGQMKWTDTVGQAFPDASVHEDWKPATLRQLLTHTSGAPRNFGLLVRWKRPAPGAECTQARRQAVIDVIAEKPESPPGTKFAYSNVGFTIAGAMAEKAAGVSWEDLVRREVFEPLELANAGFGPPKSSSKTLDQPRGHHVDLFGGKTALDTDNTPIMGPAGTIHMTLSDLSTYANEHLRGELGSGKLLSAGTYKLLHTPELDDYACGWVKKEPTYDIPHTLFWHNGSNTMWYALVVFIPDKNLVVAVASNDGDIAAAESAAWEIAEQSAKKFNTAGDAERRKALAKSLPINAYPKTSPFSAVRWQDAQPEVRVGREWFTLVSIDGIAADDIVAFCKKTYAAKWRMRFEEDLVAVLFQMGYEPGDAVRLVVRPSGSSETKTLDDVELTHANRDAIKRAAMGR